MSDPVGAPAGDDKPPRRIARVEDHLGRLVLAWVPVRDGEWLARRRRAILLRSLVFVVAVLLATALGPVWIPLAVAPVVHQVCCEPRRLLVATAVGLAVVEVRPFGVETVTPPALGTSASITLRLGRPTVDVEIAGPTDAPAIWRGTVSGSDLKRAEAAIRAGGGEPARTTC
ncbi:MAG TPA: hypothetical protein DEP66_03515 [Acidimicrobiaceae bacterium]|nr:hypothetical protein [Acidimicrobiaceae bacterium]HCB37283.1 hypothetical protein [Acidimicrobiaceae bacterium]